MHSQLLGILFSLTYLSLNTSDPDIFISGNFQNTPFDQFVSEIEIQSGAQFYYLEEWISGITITESGDHISLSGILNNYFHDRGLHFVIDVHKNVFITRELELISNLPDYQSDYIYFVPDEQSDSKELTQIEKKYIEGRAPGVPETIVIGTEDGDNIHGKAAINGKLWDIESGEPLTHLFGFFSAFSPDIIKDFSFYKSNVPAKYGGRLASIFDISTKQGNNKRFSARGGISPVTGHMAIEGPLKKEHSSFIISARSTYSDWLLSRLEDPDLRNSDASFHDFTAKINSEINDNNLLKGFLYYSFDGFSLASNNKYQYSNLGRNIQ